MGTGAYASVYRKSKHHHCFTVLPAMSKLLWFWLQGGCFYMWGCLHRLQRNGVQYSFVFCYVSVGTTEEINRMGDCSVHGMIVVKYIVKECDVSVRGLNLVQSLYGLMETSFQYGNSHLGFTKGGEFFSLLSAFKLLKQDSVLHWVKYKSDSCSIQEIVRGLSRWQYVELDP
jgi:hypothetical protein